VAGKGQQGLHHLHALAAIDFDLLDTPTINLPDGWRVDGGLLAELRTTLGGGGCRSSAPPTPCARSRPSGDPWILDPTAVQQQVATGTV
jgi:hypothetical protein